MYDSCMKSVQRLTEVIEAHDEEKIGARIATYTDKRDHYPPSMKRVLELIDIEMKHRSTVNGEILRIQQDVRQKFVDLESVIKDMDAILDEFAASRKLRDSISTVISTRTDMSDTPASSPASSIVMSRKGSDQGVRTPAARKPRVSSAALPRVARPDNRRYSSTTLTTPTGPSISTLPWNRYGKAPSRTGDIYMRAETPKSERPAVKPRWCSSVNMNDTVVGHNYKPLSLTTPSPYRRSLETSGMARSVSSMSNIPVRSPLSRSSALSPPPSMRPMSTTPAQQARRLASPMNSPATPARNKLPMRPSPRSSTPASSRHAPIAEEDGDSTANEESPVARRATRPPSVLNSSRRSSMLPTPTKRNVSTPNVTPTAPGRGSRMGNDEGRMSRVGDGRMSRSGRESAMDKPGWR
jgi:hypothetical protein